MFPRCKVSWQVTLDWLHVRIVDDQGVARSLMHVATDWPGHYPNVSATIAALATAGVDVNARMSPHPKDPNCMETPLHWAASSYNRARWMSRRLLERGADMHWVGWPTRVATLRSPHSSAWADIRFDSSPAIRGRARRGRSAGADVESLVVWETGSSVL